MASTHKSLRSSTANKRPTTAIADGQIALNTNATSPGLFFKDSAGATIIKVGPVHVGTTAPNATPAAGGSSGNSTGEVWLDTSLTPVGVKIWSGGAWTNATPVGSTTVKGLLELATNAETQAGSDAVRAVTPASLQSKVSDSTSTTSSTTIASSTAVKSAYDLANAALPKTGGTVTGNVTFGTTGVLAFEGSTDDGFETAIGVSDPTADRTVTIPDQNGNFLISGNASIVNADVNASAAIAGTKISPNFGAQNIVTTGTSTAASFIPTSSTVPTNGVYLPSANNVAISTNGTGRLFVDASGNVAIGNSSANNRLLLYTVGVNDSYIQVANGSTGLAVTQGLRIGTQAAGNANIVTDGLLTFGTGNIERLRITSDGKLGLGTSAPSERLHLIGSTASPSSGTAYNILRLVGNSGTPANAGGLTIGAYWNNTDVNGRTAYIQSSQGLDAGSTARALLLNPSGGNVGVGTASPGGKFQINVQDGFLFDVGAGAYAYMRFGSQGAGEGVAELAYDRVNAKVFLKTGATGSALSTRLEIDGAGATIINNQSGTERARIDSSGRLLVGTSSQSGGALLQVNGDRVRIATAKTPASASDTGTTGEVCWDASYIYVCTATNTWKRAALSTW